MEAGAGHDETGYIEPYRSTLVAGMHVSTRLSDLCGWYDSMRRRSRDTRGLERFLVAKMPARACKAELRASKASCRRRKPLKSPVPPQAGPFWVFEA